MSEQIQHKCNEICDVLQKNYKSWETISIEEVCEMIKISFCNGIEYGKEILMEDIKEKILELSDKQNK